MLLGSLLFALCGLPQAIQSYKDKNSDGLNWLFIIAWFFGEIFTLENLATKRPGIGISPMRLDEILGKKALRDFSDDELIEL